MGQWDILEFLGENAEGWFTARQIAEQLGASPGSVASCTRRLQRVDLLACKTVKWTGGRRGNSRDVLAYRYKAEKAAGDKD